MKLDNAIELGRRGHWQDAEIRISPSDPRQWFVMLRGGGHKAFILADNEDQPIASEDMNLLVQLLRSIGLKEVTVNF